MPDKKLEELNQLYQRADSQDREVFAEMRSNVLLVAGEHYDRLTRRIASNLRGPSYASRHVQHQKLRLTKNHAHRVNRSYEAAMGSHAVRCRPQRENELQDQKDAEMHQSIYEDAKNRDKWAAKFRDYKSDFTTVGEVCVKMYWDPFKGDLIGYEPKIDPMTDEPELKPMLDEAGNEVLVQSTDEFGQPLLDETGQPVMEAHMCECPDYERPVFTGGMCYERIFAANLLRSPVDGPMDENPCWIIRKMTDKKYLERKYADQPDILRSIQESRDDTYVVFDSNKASYEKAKHQSMVREFYWRPSVEYPKGWYVYATNEVILEQGELPEGIWPLIWQGFDESQASPRGRSIQKIVRPYQAEINRASSAQALAQVTLGDDKVLYQAGTKLSQGSLLPGVRGIAYNGREPIILSGRSGAQFLDYINAQVSELDRAVMIAELMVETDKGGLDPYALLFRSMSNKKKFSKYTEKWQEFVKDFTMTFFKLAKAYYPDDMVVAAVGRNELVNMPEWKKTTDLSYRITIDNVDEDIESLFGRQLMIQHVLQYAGDKIDRKDLGRFIKLLPYGNVEGGFEELTMDEDNATNDMLALDRGEQPMLNEHVDPVYMIQKLTNRMKKPDFRYLPPEVQQNYVAYRQQYMQLEAQQAEKIKAMQNEYIPVDGPLVKCDVYVEDPQNPGSTERAKAPQRALEWLFKQLESQGATREKLESMNKQALSQLAEQVLPQLSGQGAQPEMAPPMPIVN